MKRRAQIVGTVHPAGLMRAQVRVLPDWNGVPDDDLLGGIPVTHQGTLLYLQSKVTLSG